MVENKEEFGYPHEIILSSIRWANKVIKGTYRKRTKILAFFLLNIVGKAPSCKIETIDKDDYNFKILYYAIKKNKVKIISGLRKHEEKLKELVDQYKERKSGPALKDIENFVSESIFVHLILKERTGKNLLKKDVINDLVSNILKDSPAGKILESITLLNEKTELNETKVNDLIKELHSIDQFPYKLYSMFVTFNLATEFKSHKNKFLFEHYWALKESVAEFEKVTDLQRLDDTILKKLFMISIILYLCGYQKSLRLPHEEKINYFEHVLSVNTVTSEFKKAFAKNSVFDLKLVKIPLWVAALIDAILISIGALWNVYLPAGLSLGPLSFELPFDIPIFPILALILAIFIIFKIYKLKDYITKDLRTGG